MIKPADIAHVASFEQAHAAAKTRADWWLDRWRKGFAKEGSGSLVQTALAFEREAEEQQRAAGRLAAARRYVGLPPE